ncbi:unnamed protein product [Rotaria sp. Silwood1]|nr:unnamed protein product [Rotaria sp. Silwood1]
MRQVISSSLFTGASFSVNTEHLIDAIKSIPGAIAIYPIYFASGPQYFENYWPIGRKSDNQSDSISAHKLTGVDRVHKELKNFGKGVRIAIIDNGIDYYHPALGGCFGPDCKVAFGYGKMKLKILLGIQRNMMIELFPDLVGDEFSGSHIIPEPDDDPLDNCSRSSHGTHIAGILAANATEIVQTNYSPLEPFIGVAPQATIGAYRIFGCSENGTTTDLITAAIYRAFEDKADIIYVVCSMGNDGRKGLQTGANPAIAKDAIAVGSVDNSYEAQLYLITPNGEKIFYIPGIAYGGWRSTICSTIVVNALYLSQIGNPAPETVNKAFNNGTTHRPSISEVLNLFQSNANPVNIYNSTLLASTVQQGAGLVNAFQALTATTIISPSELALNDTVRQQESYVIEVFNIGKKTTSYNISHHGAALITGIQDGNDQLLSQPLYSADYATVHIWPEYFQLDPGQSRTVTLKFHASDGANPNFLPIYSGFIDVANDVDEKVVHVPYAGVVGNYSDARILVRNNPQGFITGIVGDDGYYITDGQELNITAAGVFLIILVTAWASRTILVEVVSAENNGLPELDLNHGMLFDPLQRKPLYFVNVPRNGATGFSESYEEYSLYLWSGLVAQVVTIQNDLFLRTTRLAPGRYKLRFSALKNFGDYRNDNDYEVYYTPSFNFFY